MGYVVAADHVLRRRGREPLLHGHVQVARQDALEERHGMTDVTINVEAEPGVTGHTVAKHLRERLGFLPKGDVFPVGALPRSEGQAKRVIRRKVD